MGVCLKCGWSDCDCSRRRPAECAATCIGIVLIALVILQVLHAVALLW